MRPHVLLLPLLLALLRAPLMLLAQEAPTPASAFPAGSAPANCMDLRANNGGGEWKLCYDYSPGDERQLRLQVSAEMVERGGWLGFGFSNIPESMSAGSVL